MSFTPITITDEGGDETTVNFDGHEIVVTVHDAALAPNLMDEAYDLGMNYATGAYSIEQARELRDALTAAIEAATPTYCLLDESDGDWWVFVPEANKGRGGWLIASNIDDRHASAFVGFDSFAGIIAEFGVRA